MGRLYIGGWRTGSQHWNCSRWRKYTSAMKETGKSTGADDHSLDYSPPPPKNLCFLSWTSELPFPGALQPLLSWKPEPVRWDLWLLSPTSKCINKYLVERRNREDHNVSHKLRNNTTRWNKKKTLQCYQKALRIKQKPLVSKAQCHN